MYSNSLSYDMERLKVLEEEQEMLNSSLIALTTHFAQVLNGFKNTVHTIHEFVSHKKV